MGLEELKEELISSAKKEKDKLLADVRKEARKILQSADDELAEYRKKVEADTAKLKDMIQTRELSAARFEAKKSVLNAKKVEIDKVFDEVKEQIKEMSESKRQKMISKLVKKAMKEIDVAYIQANSRDESFISGAEFVKNDKIVGGIIAENEDRTVNVDYSFDQTLEQLRNTYLEKIAGLLF